ncbi:MAG: hypothetical protein AAF810_27305, partial [Cyanobacteria bacterium P01_D01_bin.36]
MLTAKKLQSIDQLCKSQISKSGSASISHTYLYRLGNAQNSSYISEGKGKGVTHEIGDVLSLENNRSNQIKYLSL